MPERWRVALLCFAANVIAHADRISLSVAVPAILAEYRWDTAQMGWVLSAFFSGYTLLMIPAGLAAQRFGPRRMFGYSIGLWSLFTMLTPLPRTIAGMAAVRFLLGVGESGTAACINGTLARWFPPTEYSRAAGLCWSGGYMAPLLAFPLATGILQQFGWRAIFVGFGLLGFLWLPLWLRVAWPALPASAGGLPRLSMRLWKAPAVWAVFLLHFSSNWFLYVMISWLPTYLALERKLSLPGMAAGAAVPFLFAWVGTNTFAWAIDRATPRLGSTRARKLFLLPYALAGASIFAVPRAESAASAIVLLCAAMGLLASATPIFSSASLNLAPRIAAPLAAVQNAFANLSGVIAPAVVGYLVKAHGWPSAFTLTTAVCLAGIAAYLLFGDAEPLEGNPQPAARVNTAGG
ncbi:MAG: MFS transporter [Bryobacterales bacterium]|nr:MFS transporter [Bryobacterales bacterium]